MPKTHRNTWKQMERDVAEFFHGKRTPLSGGASGHTRADVIHDKLFIECKLRAKFAMWSLWENTKSLAAKEEKVPVICIREKHKKGFLIVVHSEDFMKL